MSVHKPIHINLSKLEMETDKIEKNTKIAKKLDGFEIIIQ
jgi:hypothetical protein